MARPYLPCQFGRIRMKREGERDANRTDYYSLGRSCLFLQLDVTRKMACSGHASWVTHGGMALPKGMAYPRETCWRVLAVDDAHFGQSLVESRCINHPPLSNLVGCRFSHACIRSAFNPSPLAYYAVDFRMEDILGAHFALTVKSSRKWRAHDTLDIVVLTLL